MQAVRALFCFVVFGFQSDLNIFPRFFQPHWGDRTITALSTPGNMVGGTLECNKTYETWTTIKENLENKIMVLFCGMCCVNIGDPTLEQFSFEQMNKSKFEYSKLI